VPEAFEACSYLLAGFFPEAIEIDKNKKPKDISWKTLLKLMKNPDDFLNRLINFKDIVDRNEVHAPNVHIVKNKYISDPNFTVEKLAAKSAAAKGICDWVINIVKYWDVIQ
jgi:dynein heavy chain